MIDDISNAVMEPFDWIDIAVRAVYHELAALVEHELQDAAHAPWAAAHAPSCPSLAPGQPISAEFRQWFEREISDTKFAKLVRLIDDHYGITCAALPGIETIKRVRNVANDLKHRKGLVDRRRPEDRSRSILAQHELETDQARAHIQVTWAFLDALWAATDTR